MRKDKRSVKISLNPLALKVVRNNKKMTIQF